MQKTFFLLTLIAALFFVSGFFVSCRQGQDAGQAVAAADFTAIQPRKGENFEEFYNKFLTDSVFQMTRIRFPLQGRGQFVDSLSHKDEYYYTQDVWVAHKPIDFTQHTDFKRFFKDQDFLVQEIVEYPDAQKNILFFERRWYFDDGKWSLIFYGAPNFRNLDAR